MAIFLCNNYSESNFRGKLQIHRSIELEVLNQNKETCLSEDFCI